GAFVIVSTMAVVPLSTVRRIRSGSFCFTRVGKNLPSRNWIMSARAFGSAFAWRVIVCQRSTGLFSASAATRRLTPNPASPVTANARTSPILFLTAAPPPCALQHRVPPRSARLLRIHSCSVRVGGPPGPLFAPVLRGGKILTIDGLTPQTVREVLARRAKRRAADMLHVPFG